MPTVLRWNGYRFYFFSNEGDEPRHIHVDKAGKSAKYWLEPVSLAKNFGFSASELREIESKIAIESKGMVEKWDEYFSGHS
jgi:hypothetical protein